MIITYLGIQFLKIQAGDITVAVNPVSKNSKFKTARFGADIVLESANHSDMNGAEMMEFGEKKPFVVNGPGEYEAQKVFVKGFPSVSYYGGKEIINTIYLVNIDGINICILGVLNKAEISNEMAEIMESVDILIIPIGGDGVFDANVAHKFAVSLEPKIIIPVHYGEVGEKNALKTFLKEAGEEDVKSIDKLTIKKKDLEGKEGEIVVLENQNVD